MWRKAFYETLQRETALAQPLDVPLDSIDSPNQLNRILHESDSPSSDAVPATPKKGVDK